MTNQIMKFGKTESISHIIMVSNSPILFLPINGNFRQINNAREKNKPHTNEKESRYHL